MIVWANPAVILFMSGKFPWVLVTRRTGTPCGEGVGRKGWPRSGEEGRLGPGRETFQQQQCTSKRNPVLTSIPWPRSMWTCASNIGGSGLSRASGLVELTLEQGIKCSLALWRPLEAETPLREGSGYHVGAAALLHRELQRIGPWGTILRRTAEKQQAKIELRCACKSGL